MLSAAQQGCDFKFFQKCCGCETESGTGRRCCFPAFRVCAHSPSPRRSISCSNHPGPLSFILARECKVACVW
jgi:hypothetical protein